MSLHTKKVEKYEFIQNLIDSWRWRIAKANLAEREVAKLAKISSVQLSNILNKKTKNPRLSTIDRIEKVLVLRKV